MKQLLIDHTLNEDDTSDSQRHIILFDEDIKHHVLAFQFALKSKEIKHNPGLRAIIKGLLEHYEDMERRNLIEFQRRQNEDETGHSEPIGHSS